MTTALDRPRTITEAATIANVVAASRVFGDELSRRPQTTINNYANDLKTWCCYLDQCGITDCPADWLTNPQAWVGVSYGLVAGFVAWLLKEGYAIASVNRKLSTVRKFCGMASQAGIIPPDDLLRIRQVKTISFADGVNLDQKRPKQRVERPNARKAIATPIGTDQAHRLKIAGSDSPQSKRDALLMCLLLDHGLRAGEAVALTVEGFDLGGELFTFYRPKVAKRQTHRLTLHTLEAARAYLDAEGAPTAGPLLYGSRKGGGLNGRPMRRENISLRVAELGRAIGIANLSAHDCRHYWATAAARGGTDPLALQQAGGWNSLTMVRRYVEESKIANEGVKLP